MDVQKYGWRFWFSLNFLFCMLDLVMVFCLIWDFKKFDTLKCYVYHNYRIHSPSICISLVAFQFSFQSPSKIDESKVLEWVKKSHPWRQIHCTMFLSIFSVCACPDMNWIPMSLLVKYYIYQWPHSKKKSCNRWTY